MIDPETKELLEIIAALAAIGTFALDVTIHIKAKGEKQRKRPQNRRRRRNRKR